MPAKGDTTRRLEYVPLDDLVPSEKNPKRHDEQAIANGIAKFGLLDLPVIDERTGRLVAGHGRRTDLMARRERGQNPPDGITVDGEGRWLVPTVRGWWSRSDHEAHAAGVTLNQATIAGGFDDADLAALVNELAATDADLVGVLGFSDDELAALLAGDDPAAGGGFDGDPDEVPEAAPSITKPGDVWTLGEHHRLMCGDCRNPADVDRLLGGVAAQSIVTDPPYGTNQPGVPGDSPEELSALLDGLAALTASTAVVFQSPRTFPMALDRMRAGGWTFERMLWLYKEAQNSYPWRGWLLTSEAILVFSRGGGCWEDVHPYTHDCYKLSEVSGELSDGMWHGSVKPMSVVRDLMARVSAPGGVVLDPFVGSGTTLIAAEMTGRVGLGMEITPGYCDVAAKRYQQFTGTMPAREDGEPVDFIGSEVANAS